MAYSAIPTLVQEIQNGKGEDGSGKKMEIKKQFSAVDIYQAPTPCQTASPQRPKSYDDLWFTESHTLWLLRETLSQNLSFKKKKTTLKFGIPILMFLCLFAGLSFWFGLVCF